MGIASRGIRLSKMFHDCYYRPLASRIGQHLRVVLMNIGLFYPYDLKLGSKYVSSCIAIRYTQLYFTLLYFRT